jgi:hypothetical protein
MGGMAHAAATAAAGRAYRRWRGRSCDRGAALGFLLVVGVATLASLACSTPSDVTVKLLPFDNKSELQVVIDLPEGLLGRGDRPGAAAGMVADVVLACRRSTRSRPMPARRAVQLQRTGAALLSARRTAAGRRGDQPGGPRASATARAMPSRSTCASGWRACALPEGNVGQGGGAAAGTAGDGDAAGRDLRAGRRDPPRGRRQGPRGLPPACPSSSTSTTATAQSARRLRLTPSTGQSGVLFGRGADVFDTLAHISTAARWSAIRIAARAASRSRSGRRRQGGPGAGRARLTTPIPANALPGAGGGGAGRRGDGQEEAGSFPIFRHNGRDAEMVTASWRAISRRRSTACWRWPTPSRRDWTGLPKPEIALHGQPEDESKVDAAVGWRVGGDLGHLPRHGRGLHGGAPRHLHPGRGAVRLVQAAAGDPDADPADLHRHHGGHWLFGAPFTATSMIGFIALAGIIVRNSILLVDFIRHAGRAAADGGAARGRGDPLQADPADRASPP